LTSRIIRGNLTDYVKALWVPCLFSLLSAVVARWSYGRIVAGGFGFISLVMAGLLMVLIYGVLVLVFDRDVRQFLLSSLSTAGSAGREWMENRS